MLAEEKKIYTYQEYLDISENDRCEYVNNEIFMMVSPSTVHQDVVLNIAFEFKNYFKGKQCKPYVAPLDVTFLDEKGNKNVVQPDIFVICDKENIKNKVYEGIPTLIVEVVSPSNSSHDYITKLDLYAKAGVEEYWIINPMNRNSICYRFKNNMPFKVEGYHSFEIIKSEVFDGLAINMSELFE
ncbi:Uma2 family endonuclease [Clostridium sp.]|uniref:Uma2 family endonuclease n=1 Tax=Clostridium sp. TaxID=1506 RepID=UPI003D6C75FB